MEIEKYIEKVIKGSKYKLYNIYYIFLEHQIQNHYVFYQENQFGLLM